MQATYPPHINVQSLDILRVTPYKTNINQGTLESDHLTSSVKWSFHVNNDK